jgi:hypothetical protein
MVLLSQFGPNSSGVEHFLGKEEVSGSIPDLGSIWEGAGLPEAKLMALRELRWNNVKLSRNFSINYCSKKRKRRQIGGYRQHGQGKIQQK